MKFNAWYHYFWKVPFCGFLFFFGFIPGGWLASRIGLSAPAMPVGSDQATIAQYTLLATVILALGLATLAGGLAVPFLARWLILFFFTWIAYGVNNYFEAAIFTTMGAATLYTVVLYIPAALLCSAAVTWLFPPDTQNAGFSTQTRNYFASRAAGSWAWRMLAAFLAFPLVYYFFGRLISPIVLPYYTRGVSQLKLPGWDQILPVLALRSLLFLLACLPILIAWRRSTYRLFFTLGLALFLCVGGLSMIYAYWLVPVLRVTHSLEIFADELIYTGALILLLGRPTPQTETKPTPVPVQ